MNNSIKKIINHAKKKEAILFLLWIVFSVFFGYIYFKKSVSFSFIDEWNNIIAAYFLLQGEKLYSSIFFNHQILIVYISFLIQKFLDPHNLYKLILFHRLFVIFFSTVMAGLLTYRFRFKGLVIFILFESIKYYLFGNLFLAESLIVYSVIYLFYLNLLKLDSIKLKNFDYILSGIFVWFIIWMREPYIPLALILYGFILFNKNNKKEKIISIITFFFLSLCTFLSVDSLDFVYQVIILNSETIAAAEARSSNIFGVGILKIIFYPLVIFIEGKLNLFRVTTMALSAFFLCEISILFKNKLKLILFILVVLALAGIRIITPGIQFYEAFHMMIWYGCLITSCVYLLQYVEDKKIFLILGILVSIIVLVSPLQLLIQKTDRNKDFNYNYAQFSSMGSLIKSLSARGDTLFVEGWDSLVYEEAKLPSSYQYNIFYPVVFSLNTFNSERRSMFEKNAPSFYYSVNVCNTPLAKSSIEEDIKKKYIQVYFTTKPTCLLIKKTKLEEMNAVQLKILHNKGFHI